MYQLQALDILEMKEMIRSLDDRVKALEDLLKPATEPAPEDPLAHYASVAWASDAYGE